MVLLVDIKIVIQRGIERLLTVVNVGREADVTHHDALKAVELRQTDSILPSTYLICLP
jgi:hypothetical protein